MNETFVNMSRVYVIISITFTTVSTYFKEVASLQTTYVAAVERLHSLRPHCQFVAWRQSVFVSFTLHSQFRVGTCEEYQTLLQLFHM